MQDLISRQAAIDMVEDMTDQFGNKHRVVTEGMISLLPSVTPTMCIAKISFDKEAFQKIVDEKVQELVTHGTCKDCSRKQLDKEESEEVGAEKYFCPVVCGYVDETPDFYCEKFEKRGSKDERTN